MTKNRLEAFSDGVIAILITIMVLELKVPQGHTLADLKPSLPMVGFYLVSFVMLGIYWNNHHHMLHLAKRVDGSVLWANQHLLFWLSLIPFGTAWVGESGLVSGPMAVYCFILLASGFAYRILALRLVRLEGLDSPFARALGNDRKTIASEITYLLCFVLSFVLPIASAIGVVAVAILWLVPDRRFERVATEGAEAECSDD